MINNLSNSYKASFCGVNTQGAAKAIKHLSGNPFWDKGIAEITELSNKAGQDVILKGTDSMTTHGDCFIEATNAKPVLTPWEGSSWKAILSNSKHKSSVANNMAISSFFSTIKQCLCSYNVK